MAGSARQALQKVMEMLQSEESLPAAVAAVSMEEGVGLPALRPAQIRALNAAPDVMAIAGTTRFPSLHIYCDRVSNVLREKYRRFSGTVRIVVELRHSRERMEGLEEEVRLYADALALVLDSNRGDWGDGVFYPGGYEVTFGAVKQGGINFLQSAKATFDLEVSY